MPLRRIPRDEITEQDLLNLLGITEGKTIEFKRDLSSNKDDRDEFLKDVTAFANAGGGEIVYGMEEDQGEASNLCGIQQGIDVDKAIQQLENWVQTHVEPRIPSFHIEVVELPSASAKAVVVRIPKSWAQPHLIKMRPQFYTRRSNGASPMDIGEIRDAFNLSATAIERIRKFRTDRLLPIIDFNQTIIPLISRSNIVLHVVPIDFYRNVSAADLNGIYQYHRFGSDVLESYNIKRYNFDGVLRYGLSNDSDRGIGYLQIFRNGTVEYMDALQIAVANDDKAIRQLPSDYEIDLIDVLATILDMQKFMKVEPPLFVMLSLLKIKHCIIHNDGFTATTRIYRDFNKPIDRDNLLASEIVIGSFDIDPQIVLKPAFDSVWNAAGWPRSFNYDEDGNWIGGQ